MARITKAQQAIIAESDARLAGIGLAMLVMKQARTGEPLSGETFYWASQAELIHCHRELQKLDVPVPSIVSEMIVRKAIGALTETYLDREAVQAQMEATAESNGQLQKLQDWQGATAC